MMPAFLLAMFYPNVGSIAGLFGAFGTMFCIYVLPLATYVSMLYQGILPPRPGADKVLKDDDGIDSELLIERKRANTASFSGEKFME